MNMADIVNSVALRSEEITSRAIPEAKWLLRRLTAARAQQIAKEALGLPTSAEIEELMAGVLKKLRE